jgi:transcriptional regulator with XRE-family HTH domain
VNRQAETGRLNLYLDKASKAVRISVGEQAAPQILFLTPEVFGSALRKLRKKSGLSQAALVRRYGWKSGHGIVSAWERGLIIPRRKSLLKLLTACGATIEDLLSELRSNGGESNGAAKCARLRKARRASYQDAVAYVAELQGRGIEAEAFRGKDGATLVVAAVMEEAG